MALTTPWTTAAAAAFHACIKINFFIVSALFSCAAAGNDTNPQ
jgi:hypothetical protein